VSDSDSLYHRLFSHPDMVEELVREFVPEALAAGLDFSGLQRVNPKFHIGRRSARRREGDVIWRLPTREGADIYLYLLMEFLCGAPHKNSYAESPVMRRLYREVSTLRLLMLCDRWSNTA